MGFVTDVSGDTFSFPKLFAASAGLSKFSLSGAVTAVCWVDESPDKPSSSVMWAGCTLGSNRETPMPKSKMPWTSSARKTLNPIRPSLLVCRSTVVGASFAVIGAVLEMGIPVSVKLLNNCVDKVARNIKVKLRIKFSDAGRAGDVDFRQVVAYDINPNKHESSPF